MAVIALYENIYTMLTSDSEIRELLGLGEKVIVCEGDLEKLSPEEAEELTKALNRDKVLTAKKVQRRSRPVELVDNIPIITFYAPPGSIEAGNHLVYVTNIVFDVYTKDDVTLAHQISNKLTKFFNNKLLPMKGLSSFAARFKTAHESQSDLENTYCFTTVIEFSIELE